MAAETELKLTPEVLPHFHDLGVEVYRFTPQHYVLSLMTNPYLNGWGTWHTAVCNAAEKRSFAVGSHQATEILSRVGPRDAMRGYIDSKFMLPPEKRIPGIDVAGLGTRILAGDVAEDYYTGGHLIRPRGFYTSRDENSIRDGQPYGFNTLHVFVDPDPARAKDELRLVDIFVGMNIQAMASTFGVNKLKGVKVLVTPVNANMLIFMFDAVMECIDHDHNWLNQGDLILKLDHIAKGV